MRSMTTLAKRMFGRLFAAHVNGARPTRIVLWWEYRRLPYNIIVGATGLLTTAVMLATAFTCERSGAEPIGLPDPPILFPIGVIAFGVLANVLYTAGWITELLVAKISRIDLAPLGPVAFALGTLFSIFVALAPAGSAVLVAALTSCRGF